MLFLAVNISSDTTFGMTVATACAVVSSIAVAVWKMRGYIAEMRDMVMLRIAAVEKKADDVERNVATIREGNETRDLSIKELGAYTHHSVHDFRNQLNSIVLQIQELKLIYNGDERVRKLQTELLEKLLIRADGVHHK